MRQESDPQGPAVRRVVLPSGRTIEIVYFAEPATAAARGEAAADPRRLHVCPRCESNLVHPVEWEPVTETEWQVELRCPNCEWLGEGVFEQAAVDELDARLDEGTQALVRDLRHLMHANMEEEVERFIAALHAGHVFPMDF